MILCTFDVMAWRAMKNAAAGLIAGLAGGILLLGLLVIWGAALISLIDGPGGWEHAALYVTAVVLIPVALPWLVQGMTSLQRSRLLATLDIEIVPPARTSGRTSWSGGPWLATATWLQLGYHALALPMGIGGALLAFLFPVFPGLARWSMQTDERLARRLLGPTRREKLTERVESLARSRADLVAAADAERRRIERDLHDGAQQRLVSLAMNLGMARERFGSEPEPVREALAAAHDEAMVALTELREFIRGLHPAVLSDRGLDAALSGLAARAPLPVRLQVIVSEPAAPGVEAVAYFIVSEAITNVVKHAQATRAEVTVTRVSTRGGDVLRLTVTDDGRGGAVADAGDGTGLRGLAQRAAAVDGTLTIDSPPGGPTTITAELPCES
jgi:signal transduction histidine kinase